MKVQILTIGKFHFFHLARQLDKFKKLERIYSGYPNKFIKNEKNISKKTSLFNFSFYSIIFIFLYTLKKIDITGLKKIENYLSILIYKPIFNNFKKYIKSKSILITNSGFGLESAIEIKKTKGLFICDRGAAHIKYQDKILRKEHSKHKVLYNKITSNIIKREIEEYNLADLISVPSTFVKRTFIQYGIDKKKLFLNPYGVEKKTFYFKEKKINKNKEFNILFVGNVTLQKGIFYLLDAFTNINFVNKKLTIIGPIDTLLKKKILKYKSSKITFIKKVEHQKLIDFYSNSDVFVLPSIQDGFGMVITEALACGCPVIATENTGARDIFQNNKAGFIIKPMSSKLISNKINLLIKNPILRKKMSNEAINTIKNINGWNKYGERWNDKIDSIITDYKKINKYS